jgi:hypothetical protein
LTGDGALALVDEAAEVTGRVPAWVGLLWLTALPARLLLAMLCIRLHALGESAVHHGAFLQRTALFLLAAWLLSLWGRQAFVRACRHALQSSRPAPASLLRIPARELAGHVAAALLIELLFWALLLTLVAPIFLLIAAAQAAAAAPAGGPSPRRALAEVFRATSPISRLVRLFFLFLLALPVAALNLHLLAHGAVWLAGGIAALDVAAWPLVLDARNPAYLVLLLTGALLLLEPLWLAAITAHVEKVRARSTGDDLRRWFSELRAAA